MQFINQFVSNLLYAFVLLFLFLKNKIDIRKYIYYVGIVSVLGTLTCLIIPSFGDYVRNSLLYIPDEITSSYLEKTQYRGFGIANGLTYDYGIILGIIFGYCLYLGLDKKWHFLVLTPFLLIAILVNARTGFLIFLSSIILYYFYYRNGNVKNFTFGVLCFFIFGSFVTKSLSEDTKLFISSFFDDLLFKTEGGSTFDVLVGRMIILPSSFLEWFFGSGKNIFASDNSSDVGFIIQLNYGGVILILLLLYIYSILLKMFNSRYLVLLSIFLLVIANFKGNFFFNSASYRLITFIAIIEYYFQGNYSSSTLQKQIKQI